MKKHFSPLILLLILFISSCQKAFLSEDSISGDKAGVAKTLHLSSANDPTTEFFLYPVQSGPSLLGDECLDKFLKFMPKTAHEKDSLLRAGELDCLYEKPSKWPNLASKAAMPAWLWQITGGYNPDDPRHLPLTDPPNPPMTLPDVAFSLGNNNGDSVFRIIRANITFPLVPNGPITFADLNLTQAEVAFLDEYFAQKVFLIDGLRSMYPTHSVLSFDEELMYATYYMFKNISYSGDLQHNFFGEANTNYLADYLFNVHVPTYNNDLLLISTNLPFYASLYNIIGTPIAPGESFHVLLPKWYLYLLLSDTELPIYVYKN